MILLPFAARATRQEPPLRHLLWLVVPAAVAGCGSDPAGASPHDAAVSLGDPPFLDAGAPDGDKPRTDGGFVAPDGGVIREDRFVTDVVSFTPGECAGFGLPAMPDVVKGPPVGAGALAGSLDVVSLGIGGEGSASADRAGDEPAGSDAAPREDATGGLETRQGELRIPGMHDSQEAEHPASPEQVLHAAVAEPEGDEETP